MDTTLWLVVILLGLAAVVAGVLFYRSRPPREEVPLHFRCPSCKRKLRYYPRQAGHQGRCNSCKATITFPPTYRVTRR